LRKWWVFHCFLILLGGYGFITANEMQGAEKGKAGRVLSLEEVMRIEDGGGDYYFKSPRKIRIAPDGCIFMLDDEQFLKFSPDGRFIKNLFKKGQGPGEFEGINSYVITEDALVVLQPQPNKFVILTHDGGLIREFRTEGRIAKLFAVHNGRYVTGRYSSPKIDRVTEKPSFMQVEWNLGLVSEEGGVDEPNARFSTRWYAKRLGGRAVIADHLANFSAVPYGDDHLIICHTEHYRLKLFDLAHNRVVREFGRKYHRVKSLRDKFGQIEVRPGVSKLVSPVEYVNDVQQIFSLGEYIWVMTSTIERGKGVLFDVFNFKGEYVDHFYLPIHDTVKPEGLEDLPLVFSGNHLFIAEYDEDGIPAVVKYRIMDNG